MDGAVVRALAPHQCSGSIPRHCVTCCLRWFVFYSAPRGFSPGVLRFFPLLKNQPTISRELISVQRCPQ